MATATRSTFRNSALLSGLVTQDQLEQAVLTAGVGAEVGAAPAAEVDDTLLATRLVEMSILTTYQAAQIKAGRTKFSLGPYIVTDFIGQGGMGQVFKGVHQVMGRECAIKVLPLNKSTPDAISNFIREIRTQAQLDHPNLVRAFDAGRESNTHYLVVEYVPGVDLRRLIRTQGRLTQRQAASVILQAARGLDYAHKRGLVHRDVKPGNILVTTEGTAKVSDLGLAGFIYEAANDPRAGKIVGTADYLAPEQISRPGEVSHLVDIYSLGCTMYYAVCGKVPFPGGSAKDKARRHCTDTPWHPRRFNAELNEEFVEVLADMMEKDPKARVQSAAEIVARLEQFAGDAAPIADLNKQ
jgi:serine/threonine protein kinase